MNTATPSNCSLKFIVGGLIAILVFSVAVLSIMSHQQLGRASGLTEEYVDAAKNMLEYGTYYPLKGFTYILRPPGYIFFLESVLRLIHIPPATDEQLMLQEQVAALDPEWRPSPLFNIEESMIYGAQALLLGLTGTVLFLIFSRFSSLRLAFLLAMTYGLNVYAIIFTGLLSYATLHIFLTVLSIYISLRAMEARKAQGSWTFLAGVSWGVATLVRPTTLILPFFIFWAFFFSKNKSWRVALPAIFVFTVGMCVAIAPYTVRNYVKTKHVIAVNAQTWSTLWGNTVPRDSLSPNHFNWWTIWYSQGIPIYQRGTGEQNFYVLSIFKHNLAFEEAFKREVFRNLAQRPGVYLENCWKNFLSMNFQFNTVFVKIYEALQENPGADVQQWVTPGNPQDFYDSRSQNIFEGLILFVTTLSFVGGWLAFRTKERMLLVPAFVYLCFLAAHTIVLLDLMYYYIKLPFLYLFAGYAITQLSSQRIGGALTYGHILLAAIIIVELYLLKVVL